MKEEHKKILLGGLIVYLVLTVIAIISRFVTIPSDSTLIKGFLGLGPSFIPISSLILFVYVWNRGEDDIAKVGLCTIGISFLLDILHSFGLIEYSYLASDTNTLSKIITTVDSIVSLVRQVCSILALFSLMDVKNDNINKLKLVTIIAYVINTFISIAKYNFDLGEMKYITATGSALSFLGTAAEYGFIILYLVNKASDGTPSKPQPSGQPAQQGQPQPGLNPGAPTNPGQPGMVQQPMNPNGMVAQPGLTQQPGMTQPMMNPNAVMPQQVPMGQPMMDPNAMMAQPGIAQPMMNPNAVMPQQAPMGQPMMDPNAMMVPQGQPQPVMNPNAMVGQPMATQPMQPPVPPQY